MRPPCHDKSAHVKHIICSRSLLVDRRHNYTCVAHQAQAYAHERKSKSVGARRLSVIFRMMLNMMASRVSYMFALSASARMRACRLLGLEPCVEAAVVD